MRDIVYCRVYSTRQAVPGVSKKKASKAAIHSLEGMHPVHVINKAIAGAFQLQAFPERYTRPLAVLENLALVSPQTGS